MQKETSELLCCRNKQEFGRGDCRRGRQKAEREAGLQIAEKAEGLRKMHV